MGTIVSYRPILLMNLKCLRIWEKHSWRICHRIFALAHTHSWRTCTGVNTCEKPTLSSVLTSVTLCLLSRPRAEPRVLGDQPKLCCSSSENPKLVSSLSLRVVLPAVGRVSSGGLTQDLLVITLQVLAWDILIFCPGYNVDQQLPLKVQ